MNPSAQKQTQFLIFGSFVTFVVLLTAVGSTLGTRANPQSAVQAMAHGIALIAAAACVLWATYRLNLRREVGGTPELPEPARFQADLLVALALGELPTLVGFVFASSGAVAKMLSFLLISLGCFGFILPKLLEYWRLRDRQQT
ncbi:MAG TPA: hypothetical protein VGE01_14655 [Fimbriimonas sp.]